MGIPDEDVAQVRAADRHRRPHRRARRAQAVGPALDRPVPVPHGEDAVVQCQRRGGLLLLLRLPGLGAMPSPSYGRSSISTSSTPCAGWPTGPAITLHEDAEAGRGPQAREVELLDAMERAVGLVPRAFAARARCRPGPGLPALPRLRRRRGATVPAGLGPRRLGRAEPGAETAGAGSDRLGAGFVNRRGRPQDAFRARVLFPICDPSGRPVALGGRILPPGRGAVPERAEPKYKNSQESAIYSKRRTLYALNWAKHDVIDRGEVVVCEGYTDVIGFFQAGVPRAVATCGTALAEEHFTLLRNFGRRIVLAYRRRQRRAEGHLPRLRVGAPARGRRGGGRPCPAGAIRGSWPGPTPRPWPAPSPRPSPFLQFRVDRILDAGDLATAEGRARAAEAALAAVAEHPDDLVRDQYVMQLSERCRLDAVATTGEARVRPGPSAGRHRHQTRTPPP